MKRSIRLGAVLIVILVTVVLVGARIQAWNPATHIYIAQKVYPAYANSQDLWYGAIAPDMAMYVPDGYSWDSAFWDTHWTATDLRPWAWNAAQRAFAKGWVTHNEMYGADHYAHGYPPLYLAGYVTFRANLLAAAAHISPDLAHYAIEIAVDILIQSRYPWLADQIIAAVPDPNSPTLVNGLLTRVFVWWPLQRTDVTTLMAAESAFGQVVLPYAGALKFSNVRDYEAMVDFAWQAARQIDPSLSEVQVRQLLQAAIRLCSPDYLTAVNLTVKAVSLSVPK